MVDSFVVDWQTWLKIVLGCIALFTSIWRFIILPNLKTDFVQVGTLEKFKSEVETMQATQKDFEKCSETNDSQIKEEIAELSKQYTKLSGQIASHGLAINQLSETVEKTNTAIQEISRSSAKTEGTIEMILDELRSQRSNRGV